MASPPVQNSRIQGLNNCEINKGRYILYWMQQSQRAEYNHALEYAIQQANKLDQLLLVVFGLMGNYPEANLRHYTFMLEGLKETQAALASRGIRMVLRHGHPPEVALKLGQQASMIVCDRGYLRHQRAWREQVAQEAKCLVVQVESDVIVPLAVVSNKAEYAARTIRPKIHKHFQDYLVNFNKIPVKTPSLNLHLRSMNLADIDGILRQLSIDRSVPAVSMFYKGGTSEARKILKYFLKQRIQHYADHSNQPQTDDISHMSPYLHFGQISPLLLALQVQSVDDSM